jgi:competence protein ComEA
MDDMPTVSLSRRAALGLVVAALALLALAGGRLAGTGGAESPRRAAAIAPVAAATPTRLVVYVVGAVRRPGLYRLPEGSRIADAITRAGGLSRKADLLGVNLAAPLADGVQVVVPARVAATGGGAQAGAPGKVSLATATLEQLDELPGVGPVTAQKIVDYRTQHGPFRSVDDLDAIPGIGPARIEQLRDAVTP